MAIDLPGLTSPQLGNTRSNRVTQEHPGTSTQRGEGQARPSLGTEPGAADTVQISDDALAIQETSQAISSEPEVNSERVAELRAAIDSGEYEINTERVAQGMLAIESLFS